MKYPVCLNVKSYSGSDLKKQNQWTVDLRIAGNLKEWLDSQMRPLIEGERRQFDYCDIVSELGINGEDVKRILMRNGGGANGITISR